MQNSPRPLDNDRPFTGTPRLHQSLAGAAATGLDAGELEHWRDLAADTPDLRMAKIMRIRRAIISQEYDEEPRIERMLGMIQRDLTILCRDS